MSQRKVPKLTDIEIDARTTEIKDMTKPDDDARPVEAHYQKHYSEAELDEVNKIMLTLTHPNEKELEQFAAIKTVEREFENLVEAYKSTRKFDSRKRDEAVAVRLPDGRTFGELTGGEAKVLLLESGARDKFVRAVLEVRMAAFDIYHARRGDQIGEGHAISG